jgi:hypothetical protein
MFFQIPYYAWLFIGIFLGLILGNKKFRKECTTIFDRLVSPKKKKPENTEVKDETQEPETTIPKVNRSGRGGIHIREIHFDD